MRSHERTRGLLRAPKLAWDVLVRGRYDFIYDRMPIRVTGMSAAKRFNLFKSGANLLWRKLAPWSMPLHLEVELTNYCNLRCPVCPTGSKRLNRPAQAIDVPLFERLMSEVGPYLLTLSLFGWGEPLLHPRLAEILRAARKHSIATILSTNGQHLNHDSVLDALLSEPPACLIVALDGLTDETNSVFRVGAKLEPALAGVRKLAQLKKERGLRWPVLHMRYIVMKHNQHELPRLENFARDHGFELLTCRTLSIIDSDSPDQVHREFVPDAEAWRAYGYQDGARVRRQDFICQEPFWFPSVFADGAVVCCEQDFNAQQPFGSLAGGASFAEVWRGERAARVRRIVRDQPHTLSFCRNCPYSDRPVTDCSTQAWFLKPGMDYPGLLAASTGDCAS